MAVHLLDFTDVLYTFRQYIYGLTRFQMFTRKAWDTHDISISNRSAIKVLFIANRTIHCGYYSPEDNFIYNVKRYDITTEDCYASDYISVSWWNLHREQPKRYGSTIVKPNTKNTENTKSVKYNKPQTVKPRSMFTESDSDFIQLANAYRKLLNGDMKHDDLIERWYDATRKYIVESTKLNIEWRAAIGLSTTPTDDSFVSFKTQLIAQHIGYANGMNLVSEANKHVHE